MSDKQLQLFRRQTGGPRGPHGPHEILVDYLWHRSHLSEIVNHVQRISRDIDFYAAHRVAPPYWGMDKNIPVGSRDAEWACWYDAMVQQRPSPREFTVQFELCRREFPLQRCSRFIDLYLPAMYEAQVEVFDVDAADTEPLITVVPSNRTSALQAATQFIGSKSNLMTVPYFENLLVGVEVKPTRDQRFEQWLRDLERYRLALTEEARNAAWSTTNRLARIEFVLVTGFLPTKAECSQLSHSGFRLFYAIPPVTH